MNWINKHIKYKQITMQTNQQGGSNCDINSLVPRTPCSWLNHTLDWMFIVLFWFRNAKPMDYRGISTYSTKLNYLLRQNRIPDAVFSVSFPAVDYLICKYSLSQIPSKTQQNHWLHININHLIVCPNEQSEHHCEINTLESKNPRLCLHHIID